MKTLLHLIAIAIILSTFSNCKKGFDLERNNPNDSNSTNYVHPPAPSPTLIFSRYARTNSINNIIHSGDNVNLAVYLKNTGNGLATGVQANISSSSSYVSPTNLGTHPFENIAVGSEQYGYFVFNTDDYTITFHVSSSAPIGTVMTFNLNISASPSYTWTDSFTLTVQ